jgi:hypothetical protein
MSKILPWLLTKQISPLRAICSLPLTVTRHPVRIMRNRAQTWAILYIKKAIGFLSPIKPRIKPATPKGVTKITVNPAIKKTNIVLANDDSPLPVIPVL